VKASKAQFSLISYFIETNDAYTCPHLQLMCIILVCIENFKCIALVVHRTVTSLGHYGRGKVFWGAHIFRTRSNTFFQVEAKIFHGGLRRPP